MDQRPLLRRGGDRDSISSTEVSVRQRTPVLPAPLETPRSRRTPSSDDRRRHPRSCELRHPALGISLRLVDGCSTAFGCTAPPDVSRNSRSSLPTRVSKGSRTAEEVSIPSFRVSRPSTAPGVPYVTEKRPVIAIGSSKLVEDLDKDPKATAAWLSDGPWDDKMGRFERSPGSPCPRFFPSPQASGKAPFPRSVPILLPVRDAAGVPTHVMSPGKVLSKATVLHFAGPVRWTNKNGFTRSIMPGYAACCSGDRAKRIAAECRNTRIASSVTCKLCRKNMALAREANGGELVTPERILQCSEHGSVERLSYLAWHTRAMESTLRGVRQTFCAECSQWFFPWEMQRECA